MTQLCTNCYKEKHSSDFSKNQTICKECQRKYHLRKKYGITQAHYDKMYDEQEGKCYLCDKKVTRYKLAVDHCHKTGRVRKLLCTSCNAALGMLKEDKQTLSNMISYIIEHSYDN